jgi:hypothetical protein
LSERLVVQPNPLLAGDGALELPLGTPAITGAHQAHPFVVGRSAGLCSKTSRDEQRERRGEWRGEDRERCQEAESMHMLAERIRCGRA